MSSNVFINKAGYHIEARTVDFLVSLAFQDRAGFIGADNKTDVVVDAQSIPAEKLASWKNKYGYLGRATFNNSKIIDGMNTEGFSVSMLTLSGSIFPSYDAKDPKKALGVYDIPSFVLGQAASVNEALTLLRAHQLVQSAVPGENGVFLKDAQMHYVMRDKTGNSAVLEFVEGSVKIYEKAGDILTNAPTFDWQLEHAVCSESCDKSSCKCMEMKCGYTSPSRFAKAHMLLNNFPAPTSRATALSQASALNDSLAVPALKGVEPTLWCTIKDLDEGVYYLKNIALVQGDKSLYGYPIVGGYSFFDLKAIDFAVPYPAMAPLSIQPTPPESVKKVVPFHGSKA